MSRRRLGLLVAGLLLMLLAASGSASAAQTQVVDITYEVGGFDPANGTVDVDLVYQNTDDVVESITYAADGHRYPVTNVSATGGTLEETGSGFKLTFEDGPTILSYTVGVEKETFKGSDGFNAVLTSDWGVLKGEALGMGFSTRHDIQYDLVWETEIRFGLPDGWGVAGPWNATGSDAYELPRDDALPRGFYAVGADLDVTTRQGPWKTYRYVEIGKDLGYEADVLPYLEAATPYFSSVYGNHTGSNLLAVSAPDPMHQGGLGGWNSLYVHEETDLETLAHEYAHVWQRYRPVKEAGQSALWIVEGDADYRGPLSLVATEFWSPSEADDHFEEMERRASNDDLLTRPLDAATYGNDDEQVAYKKGALVFHHFQRSLSSATDGEADSATLVRQLNAEHSPVAPDYDNQTARERKVNNSEVKDLILDLASGASDAERDDLATAFDEFVHGDRAPSFDSIERSGTLSFEDLTIDPPTALEGSPSNLTVQVTNTGPTEETRLVEVRVDGKTVDQEEVTLGAGETRTVAFQLPDLRPGDYAVRVAYLEATYRVLAPPDLVLEDVELVPDAVTEGASTKVLSTVRNAGGADGEAAVRVTLAGEAAGSASKVVAGGVSETLSVEARPSAPGDVSVTATLLQDGSEKGSATRTLSVAADGDGDGVRDAEDAYPSNPDLSEQSPVNDARNMVPGLGAAGLAALALAALAGRRRPKG